MELNLRMAALYTLVVVAATIGLTKKFYPTIQSSVKVEEREVVKKDIQTVIKEILKPDGTRETVTTIVDRTKEASTKTLEQIVTKKHDWFVAAGAEAKLNELNTPTYKLEVNRRILGDIYLGASANTKGTVGLQVGLSF